MLRDHMLGYQPLEVDYNYVKPYPLGIPSRVVQETRRKFDEVDSRTLRLLEFETGDHQPEGLTVEEIPAPLAEPDLARVMARIVESMRQTTPDTEKAHLERRRAIRGVLHYFGADYPHDLKPMYYGAFLTKMDEHGL